MECDTVAVVCWVVIWWQLCWARLRMWWTGIMENCYTWHMKLVADFFQHSTPLLECLFHGYVSIIVTDHMPLILTSLIMALYKGVFIDWLTDWLGTVTSVLSHFGPPKKRPKWPRTEVTEDRTDSVAVHFGREGRTACQKERSARRRNSPSCSISAWWQAWMMIPDSVHMVCSKAVNTK